MKKNEGYYKTLRRMAGNDEKLVLSADQLTEFLDLLARTSVHCKRFEFEAINQVGGLIDFALMIIAGVEDYDAVVENVGESLRAQADAMKEIGKDISDFEEMVASWVKE